MYLLLLERKKLQRREQMRENSERCWSICDD